MSAPRLQRCAYNGLRCSTTSLFLASRPYGMVPLDRVSSGRCAPRWSDSVYGELSDSSRPLVRDAEDSAADSARRSLDAFHFALKEKDRGWYDRGVSLEAKEFAAEAESAYHRSWATLHALPGGVQTEQDGAAGPHPAVVMTSPFAETTVPSGSAAYGIRGLEGELELQQRYRRQSRGGGPAWDEHAQLNLKKERQLDTLLQSTEMPLLYKAREVQQRLLEFYDCNFALQPSVAETVMSLFAYAGAHERAVGVESDQSASATVRLAQGEAMAKQPLPFYTMQTMPFLTEMRQLYAHQKRMFVAPTSVMLESLMLTLSAVGASAIDGESSDRRPLFHLAQRILLDADRFVVLPSRTTLTAFILICEKHNAMTVAVAQVRHAVKSLGIPLDASMTAALVRGLTHCGLVEESIAVLAMLGKVPVSVELLNAGLETLVLTPDPLGSFSLYKSCVGDSDLTPNAETFSMLLLACEQAGQWGPTSWLMREMQRYRVKGSPMCLNLLLKGLLRGGKYNASTALYETMRKKGVKVWPALQRAVAMTEALQKRSQ